MADPEHVERLKRGVGEWNQWRKAYPEIQPDLSGAFFYEAKLREVNLSRANLNGINLAYADLSFADFSEASLSDVDLRYANFSRTDLSRSNLSRANLMEANLTGTNLSYAKLSKADLMYGNLSYANLNHADLSRVDLSRADLNEADFSHVHMWGTVLGELDLRSTKGLETVVHMGPSHLSIRTLYLSNGKIPESFVKSTGVPDSFIEYMHSLVAIPIQYHSLFISYAHQDQAIAERLYTDLRKHDIPCWFAAHELTPGDYYRHKINEAIHAHDKLVLILSEHSIKSQWVEKEVETALKREESMNMDQQVLFPIRLDDTIMTTSRRWISSLRYHRHIGDFTGWQNETCYQQAFTTLLQHLKVVKLPTP